jgi:hypothetical protein
MMKGNTMTRTTSSWLYACAALLLASASWNAGAQAQSAHPAHAPHVGHAPANANAAAGANEQAVRISNAWARASVQGQKATGAFMTLTAAAPLQLVGVASPVAGVAEVHEMAMQGDVMRMRAIPSLTLPAGKPVELKPGGHHLMLMDLKQALKAGETVPLTLMLRDEQGRDSRVELQVPVQAGTAPAAGQGAGAAHGHKH